MLNQRSIQATSSWRDSFIRPLYESYCFANLPAMVHHLLTGEGSLGLPDDVLGPLPRHYPAVVLFFIDAFGWRFFEQYADRYPLLQHFVRDGVVSKLTSQFPSTTAAHVTCIHTGLPPAQSGVYEWFQFDPGTDRMIAPLLFSFAGEKSRDTLARAGIAPTQVFPSTTLYQRLGRAGVKSYLYHAREIVNGVPSSMLNLGATVMAYKTLPEVLVNLQQLLARRDGPTYYFLYYSVVDAIGHEYGPTSAQLAAELDQLFITLERHFLQPCGREVLFILTADHGLVEIDPGTTIYLNRTLPHFRDLVATNRRGDMLVPAGSPRDFFLHIKPDRLDEACEVIAAHLRGRALVVKTAELIEQGFFGAQPTPQFLERVGNLVVLPFRGESVYYYEREKFENRYYGHHGGLTREEMEIPLLICKL